MDPQFYGKILLNPFCVQIDIDILRLRGIQIKALCAFLVQIPAAERIAVQRRRRRAFYRGRLSVKDLDRDVQRSSAICPDPVFDRPLNGRVVEDDIVLIVIRPDQYGLRQGGNAGHSGICLLRRYRYRSAEFCGSWPADVQRPF